MKLQEMKVISNWPLYAVILFSWMIALAEYSFQIFYRIRPGDSMNARLEALETLNTIGDWCRENKPNLGDAIRVLNVSPVSSAELLAPYEGGDEDYFIEIRLTYEVGV